MSAKKELKKFLKRNSPKFKEIKEDLASTASVIASEVQKKGKKLVKKAEVKGKAIAKEVESKGKTIAKKIKLESKKITKKKVAAKK